MSVFIVFVPAPSCFFPSARTALLNMNFRHVNRLSALPTSPSFCPRCRFFKQFMTLCRLAFSCKIWITKRISNWQNPKRIEGGGRVGRRKQKRVWVREREEWADSEQRQWQPFTACNFDKGRSSSLQLFPYTPPPSLPHTITAVSVCCHLIIMCVPVWVLVCVCLRWQRALLLCAPSHCT